MTRPKSPASTPSLTVQSNMRRWWPLVALGAVAFAFFWQYFLLDQTIYAGDTAFVFFPFRQYATQRLMSGEVPLWNPYLFGGTPGLAESTYQVYYLPNLLFWITGVARGLGWTLPLHLLWLSAGVYLFARRMELGRLEAIVAAVAFTYGGSVQGRLGIPVYTQAASWIPWILMAYDVARQRGGLFMVLPGLALAMQLLTGGPPYTYYTLVLLMGWHLFHLRQRATGNDTASTSSPKTAWLAMGAMLLVSALLTTFQLLPEWELAGMSERGTHSSYAYATYGSLAPQHLITMVLPKFYGLYSSAARDGFLPSTEIGYVGILTLGLAVAAWFSPRRRLVRFWVLVTAVSVAIALGSYNPLYPFLYRYVPGIGMFRMPGCWLLISSFALAILAALGLETLRQNTPQHILAARLAAALLLLLSAISAALLLSPLGAEAVKTNVNLFGSWPQVFWIALCALPLAVLGMPRLSAATSVRRNIFLAIPVLIALDLFLVSQDMEMQQTISVAAVEGASATAKALQVPSDGRSAERFWPGTAQVPMEKWLSKTADPNMSALEYRARSTALVRSLMPSCLPAEFQTMGLTGAWGALMPLRRNARPIYLGSTPTEEKQRWLRLLNVRTYLGTAPLSEPGLKLQSSDPLYLYNDAQAMPHGFWVPTARGVAGEDAITLLSQPGFDPRREVLIEGLTVSTAPPATPVTDFDASAVRITQYRAEHISLEVNAPQNGYMVLMDSAYPGWHARVDGQETPVQIANWMGRSVAVTAGTHRIEMWFEPTTVRFGAFVSLVTFAFLTAWATSSLLTSRKSLR